MKSRLTSLVVAAAFTLTALSANAGFIGHTVNAQYLFPDISTPDFLNENDVVGAGAEFTLFPRIWDLSDTQIRTTFTGTGTFVGSSFNGIRFTDVLGTIDDIIGVTINGATNFAGFDASRITFNDDQIFINYASLSFTASTVLLLDVQFAAAAPEPASLALLGLGLLGLGVSRRKK